MGEEGEIVLLGLGEMVVVVVVVNIATVIGDSADGEDALEHPIGSRALGAGGLYSVSHSVEAHGAAGMVEF